MRTAHSPRASGLPGNKFPLRALRIIADFSYCRRRVVMIRCLEICSFFLEWGYVFVFFRMIHAFLPLRRRFPLRLAAFFVCSILATMVIYSNDLPNLLGTLLGMIVYISIFHQGHRTKKITSVLVFYPSLIAVNYLMHDIGSRCFFPV